MKLRSTFRAHLAAADAARDGRRWIDARQHYQAALAENPHLDGIWVQLGHACKESGDLVGAEAAYRRALAIRGDVADTHLQLGHLLKIAGRTQAAVAAYAEAARLQTSPWDAHTELAQLGYTPRGQRVFDVEFGPPSMGRRSREAWWFSLTVTLDGISAAEVMRLQDSGLQLDYALHDGSSSSPVRHLGTAMLSQSGEASLLARFVLPADGTERLTRLVQAGFRYGQADDATAFRLPRVWLLVEIEDDSLVSYYKQLTGG